MILDMIPTRLRVGLPVAVAAAIALAPAARAQDASTQERLDRLERDLNMLQRQVYRDGAAPAEVDSGGNPVDTELRLERLEQKMRELTGRVEDTGNQIGQLRQRVEQINSDIDVRLSHAAGAPPAAAARSSRPTSLAPPLAANETPPPEMPRGDRLGPHERGRLDTGSLTPPGTLTPPTSLLPPGSEPRLGSLTVSRAAPPAPSQLDMSARGALPSGSAFAQYNFAFGLLKQADYPAAENALRAFVQQHPRDALAGNAEYWLGETYYARGRYAEAAAVFAEGYKNYPRAAKAPDDLLKLGMSLARANQRQNACIALNQIDHDFPHAGGAIKARAAAERRRLGC